MGAGEGGRDRDRDRQVGGWGAEELGGPPRPAPERGFDGDSRGLMMEWPAGT